MKKIILLFLIIAFQKVNAQEILNNQSIIDLIELGFEEQVILAKIEASTTNFDTSMEKLKDLKDKGVSPNVLTALIKSSNKKTSISNDETKDKKEAKAPKPNDTEFYWNDGQNNLVLVRFFNNLPVKNSISESELGGIINRIMMEAATGLKNRLSFVPSILMIRERMKIDKYLTKQDKTTHVAQLSYFGTNSYGGGAEEIHLIGFSPKLDLTKSEENNLDNNYKLDPNKEEFRYEKGIMNGKSSKILKGSIIIGENYLVTIMDKSNYSPRIETKVEIEKIYQDDNNWTASVSSEHNGSLLTFNYSYDKNNTKYKTNGGTLTYDGIGITIIYPLTEVN